MLQNCRPFSISVILLIAVGTNAYSPSDRVSTLCSTQHSGYKTPWMDLSITQLPRFQWSDTLIIKTNLPRPKENEPEVTLNLLEDVKISYAFAGNKLVVPWVLLYDSKHKKSLVSLTVTFAHDDFDVLRLRYETEYERNETLDPEHPSLKTFELKYQWEAVHENDLRLGVVTMFIATLFLLVCIIAYVTYTYDRDLNFKEKSDDRSSDRNNDRNNSKNSNSSSSLKYSSGTGTSGRSAGLTHRN